MTSPESLAEHSPLLASSQKEIATRADSGVSHESNHADALFGVEPARYVTLFGYFLTNTCNAMIWISFSGIVNPVKSYYGISSSQVDNISSVYMIMYIATFWLSGLVLSRVGLGWGLATAAFLNAFAVVFRLLTLYASRSYGLLLTGNIIGGLCQVLILSAPPMLANQWFGLEERALATGVGVSTAYVGSAIGMVVPVAIVKSGTTDEFARLYWFQFGLAVLALIVCLLAKKAPSLPPTPAALAHDEHKPDPTRRSFASVTSRRESIRASLRRDRPVNVDLSARKGEADDQKPETGFYALTLKPALKTIVMLATDKSFVLLVIIAGMGQGIVWEVATFLGQFGQPFGISQSTIGWVGFTAQVSGCVGAVGLGTILGKFTDYKRILIFVTGVYILAVVLFPIAGAATSYGSSASENYTGDSKDGSCGGTSKIGFLGNTTTVCPTRAPLPGDLSSTAAAVLMFVSVSIITSCAAVQCPVIFELGVEITFPLPEEVASPLIMWAPSLVSFILVQLLGLVLGDDPTRGSVLIVMYVNVGCALLLALTVVFLNPDYKRRAFERQQLLEIAEAKEQEEIDGNVHQNIQ